jgi:hypothetical protein
MAPRTLLARRASLSARAGATEDTVRRCTSVLRDRRCYPSAPTNLADVGMVTSFEIKE